MPKRPSLQFYPGDWQRDAALRSCSMGARGLWIEMLCLMHDGYPYGYLQVGDEVNHKVILPLQLFRMVGCDSSEGEQWLHELQDAAVFSIDDDGVFYSRRMIKDEVKRNKRVENGKLGGNPSLMDNQEDNLVVNQQDKLIVADSSMQTADSNKTKNKVISYPADFMQFWEVYPNRKGKEDALKAWNEYLDDVAKLNMVEWTTSYIARRIASERSGEFVPTLPMPGTYLRQDRWVDEFAIKKVVDVIHPLDEEMLKMFTSKENE